MLAEEPGWDALIFLGHGDASPDQGGRLQLGDGSWVSGASLELPLRRAVDRGLTLVLLHCCLGIDLAHRCLAAGVAWVQVFRERVPDGAAALACRRLLHELEAGRPIALAQQRAASALEHPPWSGCRGLLSVYVHPDAPPFRWPRPRQGLGRRELLLAGGAAGVAYGLGHGIGWHGRGQTEQVTWTMAAYLGSPLYKRLLVGQVPERLAERVRVLSGGTFQIKFFDGRELSGSEVLRRVNAGREIQCGYIDVYYDRDLWPLIFAKAVPFGLNPREQTAWLWYTREGDDRPFHQTVYPRMSLEGVRLDQLRSFPLTLTGGQMGGWFKKEVNSLGYLRGLRMRIPGLGAEVLDAFGVSSDFEINDNRVIPADQILPRLRKDLDAAEWIAPCDDEVLGLHTAARYCYSHGWWEPSTTNELMVSRKALDKLSASHRLALETACAETYLWTRREYDLRNIESLARLRANGVQLRRFSPAMMEAFRRESERVLRMRAGADPQRFGYVYAEWLRFRERIRDAITVTQFQPDSPSG